MGTMTVMGMVMIMSEATLCYEQTKFRHPFPTNLSNEHRDYIIKA